MALPMFIAITSDCNDKKYLRYIREFDVAEVHGFLKLNGEDAVSPLSKYEIKMAKCGNGLVHIRCCYSNKYWQRSSEKDSWIVAGASEPEEEDSKWSCTLFEPILASQDPLSFRFRHVQLRQYVFLCSNDVAPYDYCIKAKSGEDRRYDIFKIINWERLMVLPRYIAFIGCNNSYLKAYYNNHAYLQFAADTTGNRYVGDEIFPNGNGSIRIRNNHYGKFWRRDHRNWINADADESSTDDRDTLFWPIKVKDNVIALRNEGNDMFCKVFTDGGETDCLSAIDPTISSFAQLEVEEFVHSRSICDVNYNLMDARIYNETVIEVANADAVNTTGSTNHVSVALKYTDVFTWSWSTSSISLKLHNTSKVSADIPKIAEAKAEIAASFSADYQWGKIREEKTLAETTYDVTVPPMTKVKVKLMATKGSCDIPFSYTQHDILLNGIPVTYNMDDGMYTCTNSFNFHYETSEEPLTKKIAFCTVL